MKYIRCGYVYARENWIFSRRTLEEVEVLHERGCWRERENERAGGRRRRKKETAEKKEKDKESETVTRWVGGGIN